MRHFQTLYDFTEASGEELGLGRWMVIDQTRIDRFAEATGDGSWVHIDPERASRELPAGRTLAHGYLSLALITALSQELWQVKSLTKALLYGVEECRFPAPVPDGARVRLRQRLIAATVTATGAVRAVFGNTIEVETAAKPACVAQTISLLFEES